MEPELILDQLAAAGALRPAVGGIRELLAEQPVPPAPEGNGPLSETVEVMRDEERW